MEKYNTASLILELNNLLEDNLHRQNQMTKILSEKEKFEKIELVNKMLMLRNSILHNGLIFYGYDPKAYTTEQQRITLINGVYTTAKKYIPINIEKLIEEVSYYLERYNSMTSLDKTLTKKEDDYSIISKV